MIFLSVLGVGAVRFDFFLHFLIKIHSRPGLIGKLSWRIMIILAYRGNTPQRDIVTTSEIIRLMDVYMTRGLRDSGGKTLSPARTRDDNVFLAGRLAPSC